jgi:hypothetical protein
MICPRCDDDNLRTWNKHCTKCSLYIFDPSYMDSMAMYSFHTPKYDVVIYTNYTFVSVRGGSITLRLPKVLSVKVSEEDIDKLMVLL